MLNMMDAQRAMDLVRSTCSAHSPKFLDANGCDEVFVFLGKSQFTTKFALAYNVCFKRANNFTGEARALVDYVNAFVGFDCRNFLRKNYVKNDRPLK